jgi:N-glycosylase/DNA lyase
MERHAQKVLAPLRKMSTLSPLRPAFPVPSGVSQQEGESGIVQVMLAEFDGRIRELQFPPSQAEVLPGVEWGTFDGLFTPAFWLGRVLLLPAPLATAPFRIGETLAEEIAVCLLGGHGIPADVGLAAFTHLRTAGVLTGTPTARDLEALLLQPLDVAGRPVRYRFARTKSEYLEGALAAVNGWYRPPEAHLEFRDSLLSIRGIGPKTASWITRNWYGSDEVGIIDIHIHRACVAMGVFARSSSPQHHYFELEAGFLRFAAALRVRPSVLDAVIWEYVRRLGHLLPKS